MSGHDIPSRDTGDTPAPLEGRSNPRVVVSETSAGKVHTIYSPDSDVARSQVQFTGDKVSLAIDFFEDGRTPKFTVKYLEEGLIEQTHLDRNGRKQRQTIKDKKGNLLLDAKYDSRENPISVFDRGSLIEYGYDQQGKLLQFTQKDRDGTTRYYDGQGIELRHRRSDGREFVHTRDPSGKEHIAEDKAITQFPFDPNEGLSEQRKELLDQRMLCLGRKWASAQNELDFQQHGLLLLELAYSQDLTEHDKLYILSQLVRQYRRTRDGKSGALRLTTHGANTEALHSFDPKLLSHQVIEPTVDPHHTKLALGTWEDAVKGVTAHETKAQVLNAMRFLFGAEGGGFGLNKGDALASLYQIKAIANATASGAWSMAAYAESWNNFFLSG